MPAAPRNTPTQREPLPASTWVVILYMGWLITTPFRSPVLKVFNALHPERIIVGLAGIAVMSRQPVRIPPSRTTRLLLWFFVISWISSLASPYPDVLRLTIWQEDYWKVLVFYFIVIAGLRSTREIHALAHGVVFFSLGYQLLSWFDYMRGGSYVFQQGLKRLIGVWSGGGLGAANAFGQLALFTFTFALYVFTTTASRLARLMSLACMATCTLSAFYSGTRGSVVVLAALMVYSAGRRLLRPGFLLLVVAGLAGALSLAPEDLRSRYLDLILPSSGPAVYDVNKKVAEKSAETRIDGLVDGFKLAANRPFLGYGPGASATARMEVREASEIYQKDKPLQLHNLYGQLFGEIGFIGGILWLSMVLGAYFNLVRVGSRKPERLQPHQVQEGAQAKLLHRALFALLLNGMIAHSLYSSDWLLILALSVVLLSIVGTQYVTARPRGVGGRVS